MSSIISNSASYQCVLKFFPASKAINSRKKAIKSRKERTRFINANHTSRWLQHTEREKEREMRVRTCGGRVDGGLSPPTQLPSPWPILLDSTGHANHSNPSLKPHAFQKGGEPSSST